MKAKCMPPARLFPAWLCDLMMVLLAMVAVLAPVASYFAVNTPRAVSAADVAVDTDGFRGHVDVCSITDEGITVKGWAFIENDFRNRPVHVFLTRDHETFFEVSSRSVRRSDVDSEFDLTYRNGKAGFFARAGFPLNVPDAQWRALIARSTMDGGLRGDEYVCQ